MISSRISSDLCFICEDSCEQSPLKPLPWDQDHQSSLLKRQLSVVLLVRKILEIPMTAIAPILFSKGNPASWGLKMCGPCRRIFTEAEYLHFRITELNREFNNLAGRLRDQFKVDWTNDDSEYENEEADNVLVDTEEENLSQRRMKKRRGRGRLKRKLVYGIRIRKTIAPNADGRESPLQLETNHSTGSVESVSASVKDGNCSDSVPHISDVVKYELPEAHHSSATSVEEGDDHDDDPDPLMPILIAEDEKTSVHFEESKGGNSIVDELLQNFCGDGDGDLPLEDPNDPVYNPSNRKSRGRPGRGSSRRRGRGPRRGRVKRERVDMFSLPQPIIGEGGVWRCPICGRNNGVKCLMHAHILREHYGDVNPYHCHICEKQYERQRQLRTHLLMSHGETKTPYDDPNVNSSVNINNAAAMAMADCKVVHSVPDKKPFACKLCVKSYKRREQLRLHMIYHRQLNGKLANQSNPIREPLTIANEVECISPTQRREAEAVDASSMLSMEPMTDAIDIGAVFSADSGKVEVAEFSSPCNQDDPDSHKQNLIPVLIAVDEKLVQHKESLDESSMEAGLLSNDNDGDENVDLPSEDPKDPEYEPSVSVPKRRGVGRPRKRGYRRESGKSERLDMFSLPQPIEGDGVWRCPICGRNSSVKILMHAHILREHYGDINPYHCHLCVKQYDRQQPLRLHLKQSHKVTKTPLDEPNTVATMNPVYDPSTMKAINSVPDKKPFACKLCVKSYKRREQLRLHMIYHRRLNLKLANHGKSSVCKHPQCNEGFKNITELKIHLKKEGHIMQFPIKCEVCGEGFFNNLQLKRHNINDAHFKEPELKTDSNEKTEDDDGQYFCKECNKEFQTSFAYKLHLGSKVHHYSPLKFPFQCELCTKAFMSSATLKAHQRQAHYEELKLRPKKCKYCNKILSSEKSLDQHIRCLHTKQTRFRCEECDKGFMYLIGYKKHYAIVHAKEKPFLCAECPKRFSQQHLLDDHSRVHTGEKPFECKECGKKFSDRPTFNRHMESHGDKVHVCGHCSKEFKVWHSFRLHMKSVHKEIIYQNPVIRAPGENQYKNDLEQPISLEPTNETTQSS